MLKNIYAPLSGAVAQEKALDVISNNLANANTTSYKEDAVSFKAMLANPWPNYPNPLPPAPFKTDMKELYPLHGNEMEYAAFANIKTDHSAGPLKLTQNPLDLAIEGEAYFETMTPFGVKYTRDGSFAVNSQGFLVTKSGDVVQGEQVGISGFNGSNIEVLPSGEVYCDKNFVGKLKLVQFKDRSLLEKVGNNTWTYQGAPENVTRSQDSHVRQGFLEGSNVNPVKNLTTLITAHRNYESLQKATKSQDELMKMSNKIAELQG